MASEATMSSIAQSLDLLAKVSVLQLIDGKERNTQLALLEGLGFKHAAIADLLGMKANTVTHALRRLKKGEAAD